MSEIWLKTIHYQMLVELNESAPAVLHLQAHANSRQAGDIITVPHSIFVRDITDTGYRNMKMVAHAISTSEDAESLVRGVAASYAEHGCEETTQVCWFRDKDGLHEIWAYPTTHSPGRSVA